MADGKAYDDLSAMVQEQSPASIRSASLSLAAIGDKQSLELLASNLLNGSELNRRYAAEALANNHTEGYLALKEGSGMDDLLVRRSVIFGLIRIDDKWSREIVEKLQLEDNEWVVRNAAIQAFDELAKKIDYAPTPIRDLTEAQWLIDFATRNATTVAPGKPALDLVKKALSNGTDDEKLLAMDYLRRRCDRSSLELIYHTHKNSSDELRELSYFVLWLMVCSGIHLPFSFE
jgi:HEAT repeat protein